jgi:hypothetical protein
MATEQKSIVNAGVQGHQLGPTPDMGEAALPVRRARPPNTFAKLDVSAHMDPEDYAQRAIACLQAAERAETSAERDRWTLEAIAWQELAGAAH